MAKKQIKWGVISTAKIGWEKVIPAMQKSELGKIIAIGSANTEKAAKIAADNGIATVHPSYDELINDPEVDAVYNPLPNHMHVDWTIKALRAGKHVLCEKPFGSNASQVRLLLDEAVKHPDLKVMEAFMYRFHPQWIKVRELLNDKTIGEVRTVNMFFSYYNDDPNNIRNRVEVGGGALMDIGCYCISIPKFVLQNEPTRVTGIMERDLKLETDRMTSGIMSFSHGRTATFTCSTQLMPYQKCTIYGTKGYIEVQIPVNAPPSDPCMVFLHTTEQEELFALGPADQYTLEADAFARCIMGDEDMHFYMNDALGNMKIIDALVHGAREGEWVNV